MHTDVYSEDAEEQKSVGRLKIRQEENVKIDPTEVGCEDVDWIQLPQSKI
jgi:hypothetical protein